MNKHASALGKLARGVPKNYSAEEREKRRLRFEEAKKNRWPKKNNKCNEPVK
jgi:hypothetical protein